MKAVRDAEFSKLYDLIGLTVLNVGLTAVLKTITEYKRYNDVHLPVYTLPAVLTVLFTSTVHANPVNKIIQMPSLARNLL